MSTFIYAYTHRGNEIPWSRKDGKSGNFWIKVGQTKREGLSRVNEQVRTLFPGLDGVTVLFHSEEAVGPNGDSFTDHDVHHLLKRAGINSAGGEWFEATPEEVRGAVVALQTGNPFSSTRTERFGPRPEQMEAVKRTAQYFRNNQNSHPKFLWNAKMRFGKTFATYELAREMNWTRILVLTYKPAVRSAWRDDLLNHVNFLNWKFIDNAVPSEEADKLLDSNDPVVWFTSFQDVTGRDALGNVKVRNESIHLVEWDCIVIDEFHFGANSSTARELYDPQDKDSLDYAKFLNKLTDLDEDDVDVDVLPDFGLNTKFHLHLSGTPFKALANGDYNEDQIFNWTYIDEQKAKNDWADSNQKNPYSALPEMRMYTYSMGDVAGQVSEETGLDAFDLNVFFKAIKNKDEYHFLEPDNVLSFLDLIKGKKNLSQTFIDGEKPPFPYESQIFRQAVQHSIWYFADVAACEAMAAILKNDPFFSKYKIHVAAGTKAGVGSSALGPLNRAIRESELGDYSGTITLSCGKLMTGVTVSEWSSIFMLRSLRAPESYFQAAFRVQSPRVVNGEIEKKVCFVFEFDPNRALGLVALYGTELSNNSSSVGVTQEKVLAELVNYLPIFAIDGGIMEKLDAHSILEWAHGGISANSLARRWRSSDLYNLNGVTLSRLIQDQELLEELEQIEDFRQIREIAETIISSTDRLTKLKREGSPPKEAKAPKKKLVEKRKSIRDKLKKISAKVLIFMYLTDFREERLLHVIDSLDQELFLRSTGLSLNGFKKLSEVGVFNEARMNDAIQKYRYFERKSIEASFNR